MSETVAAIKSSNNYGEGWEIEKVEDVGVHHGFRERWCNQIDPSLSRPTDRFDPRGSVQWFRGGLVFYAGRRLCNSTLGSRVIMKKKRGLAVVLEVFIQQPWPGWGHCRQCRVYGADCGGAPSFLKALLSIQSNR